jgi:hypothetical protein
MASRFGTHNGGEFETTGVELVPESNSTPCDNPICQRLRMKFAIPLRRLDGGSPSG